MLKIYAKVVTFIAKRIRNKFPGEAGLLINVAKRIK